MTVQTTHQLPVASVLKVGGVTKLENLALSLIHLVIYSKNIILIKWGIHSLLSIITLHQNCSELVLKHSHKEQGGYII